MPQPFEIEPDEIDMRETPRFQEAKTKMLKFLRKAAKEKRAVFLGALRRQFIEYEDLILSVVRDLRLDGFLSFDEHKPPPTLIICHLVKKVPPENLFKNMNWTSIPVIERGRRSMPMVLKSRTSRSL